VLRCAVCQSNCSQCLTAGAGKCDSIEYCDSSAWFGYMNSTQMCTCKYERGGARSIVNVMPGKPVAWRVIGERCVLTAGVIACRVCCLSDCQTDCNSCAIAGNGRCDAETNCEAPYTNYDATEKLCTGRFVHVHVLMLTQQVFLDWCSMHVCTCERVHKCGMQ
jgi:hypothetical protein